MRILVVQSDLSSRQTAQKVLKTLGHDIVVVEDGGDVPAVLEREPDIELVVLDAWAEGKGGIHLLRGLNGHSRPKVLITAGVGGGLSPIETEIVAETFGADGVLQKPFEADDLKAALGSLLN
ncbi:MAG: response regulator [Rhodospirillales bacterium]